MLAEVRHTGKSAKGMDPTADLVASEFSIVDDINARFKIGATSITGLGQMMREHGMLKTPTSFIRTIPEPEPVSGDKPSKITRLEWEKERRRQITQMAKRADGRLKALNVTFDDRGREWQWGDTGRIIMHRFGELSAMDMDKLDTVLKWLESEWIPETEKARSRYAHA